MNNSDLVYRPLMGGVSVVNGRIGEPGTLGCMARDASGLWILSAYHVLCDVNLGPFVGEEPIYQPAAVDPSGLVAVTKAAKANASLDCAAALLSPEITPSARQLGLGVPAAPVDPLVGMRVVKSGAFSGVTEGIITQVNGDNVIVGAVPAYDAEYVLSLPGDSGAVWMEQATLAPVALHLGHATARSARATRFLAVLEALNLRMLGG